MPDKAQEILNKIKVKEDYRKKYPFSPVPPDDIALLPVSDKRTIPGSVEFLEAQARNEAVQRGEIWGQPMRFLTAQLSKLGMVTPGVKTPQAYQSSVDLNQQSSALRAERFRTTPNPVVNFVNTPTKIFNLTPADIVGVAAITVGGVKTIRNFTEFQRLPQMKALEQMAAKTGVPKGSPQYQEAVGKLRTAYNLHKTGAVEARDEILNDFVATYTRVMNPPALLRQPSVKPFEPTLAPKGTQTGAMQFGGTPKGQKDFNYGVPAPKAGFPISMKEWSSASDDSKIALVKNVGLPPEVAKKGWEQMTPQERVVLGRGYPLTESTPVAAASKETAAVPSVSPMYAKYPAVEKLVSETIFKEVKPGDEDFELTEKAGGSMWNATPPNKESPGHVSFIAGVPEEVKTLHETFHRLWSTGQLPGEIMKSAEREFAAYAKTPMGIKEINGTIEKSGNPKLPYRAVVTEYDTAITKDYATRAEAEEFIMGTKDAEEIAANRFQRLVLGQPVKGMPKTATLIRKWLTQLGKDTTASKTAASSERPRFLARPFSEERLRKIIAEENTRHSRNINSKVRTPQQWTKEFTEVAARSVREELHETEGLLIPSRRLEEPGFLESSEMSRVRGYTPEAVRNWERLGHLWEEGKLRLGNSIAVDQLYKEATKDIPYAGGNRGNLQLTEGLPIDTRELPPTTPAGPPQKPPHTPKVLAGGEELPESKPSNTPTEVIKQQRQRFVDFLQSKTSKDAREVILVLRQEELAKRIVAYDTEMRQARQRGLSAEEADKIASEKLKGELPKLILDAVQNFTQQTRDALMEEGYQQIYVTENDTLGWKSFQTALSNFLETGSAPNKPGTAGRSARWWLEHVFGEQPEIMGAIKQGKPLKKLVAEKADVEEGKFHPIGPPKPVDPKAFEVLEALSTVGTQETLGVDVPSSPKEKLSYKPTGKLGLNKPGQQLALGQTQPPVTALRTPDTRSTVERQLDLVTFKRELSGPGSAGGMFTYNPTGEETWITPKIQLELDKKLTKADEEYNYRRLKLEEKLRKQHVYAEEADLQVALLQAKLEDEKKLIILGMRAKNDPNFTPALGQLTDLPLTWQKQFLKDLAVAGINTIDTFGAIKAVKFAFDLSMMTRQLALSGIRHPKVWMETWKPYIQAFGSEELAMKLDAALWADPRITKAVYKLRLSPYDISKQATYWNRPETMASTMAEKFIPGVRASNRSAAVAVNYFLGHVGADLMETLDRMGASEEEYWAMGSLLNESVGRGELPSFLHGTAGDITNKLLSSPRYVASRFEFPTKLFSSSKAVRQEAASTLVLWVTVGAAILALAKAAGAEVELDPRSPDAYKIRIGSKRFDIWVGYTQIVRLLAQLATQKRKTADGEFEPLTTGYILSRFAQSKSSPGASALIALMTGVDYTGNKVELSNLPGLAAFAAKSLTPAATEEIINAYFIEGGSSAALSSLGLVGTGVTTYNNPWAEKWRDAGDFSAYYNIPKDADEREARGQMSRREYLKNHPEVNAKLFLMEDVTSLSSTAAARMTVELAKENKISLLDIPEVKRRIEAINKRAELGLPAKSIDDPTDALVDTLIRFHKLGPK